MDWEMAMVSWFGSVMEHFKNAILKKTMQMDMEDVYKKMCTTRVNIRMTIWMDIVSILEVYVYSFDRSCDIGKWCYRWWVLGWWQKTREDNLKKVIETFILTITIRNIGKEDEYESFGEYKDGELNGLALHEEDSSKYLVKWEDGE